MPLVEYSKIILLKDTPETRYAFGSPIPAASLQGSINGRGQSNSSNPFYAKLMDTSFQSGWRSSYPNFTTALSSGTLPANSDGSTGNVFANALRNNILQSIGTEEGVTNGYNLAPVSSGTAIIDGDKLYIGSTTSVNYTSITGDTGDDEVVVNGTFATPVPTGSKIKLSNVTGLTGLSVNTTYYAYDGDGVSFKLASSLFNANNGTAITTTSGGPTGAGTAYLTPSGYTYQGSTTFTAPTTQLVPGDYIFWGEDPADLRLGGKIKSVYTSGSEYNQGARYEFEKVMTYNFPVTSGGPYDQEPTPQNIYYYRKSWNGKGIKNDNLTGFYLLLGVEQSSPNRWDTYPYLGDDNPSGNQDTQVIDAANSSASGDRYAFTDLIRIRRISKKFEGDVTREVIGSTLNEEIIPCTIHRTSNFYTDNVDKDTSGNLISVLRQHDMSGVAPQWVAYYINPYGGAPTKLDKNSTYVIEVNERLPSGVFDSGTTGNLIFNYAINGSV
jgi:hypothetical protein